MQILLIEDDLLLGESLKEYLEDNNITVDWIYDDRKIENIFSFDKYDVIVLDLILRYNKGENLLQNLRLGGVKTSVLILTAKNRIQDKEKGKLYTYNKSQKRFFNYSKNKKINFHDFFMVRLYI